LKNKMKKVILLSAVLGLGALGMACGESAANNTPVKPAVNTTVMNAVNSAANQAQAAANNMSNAANQMANAIKPATNMPPASNMKPANAPVMNANANKK
jgi:hypothetical protein